MARTTIPYVHGDVSSLSKSLRSTLAEYGISDIKQSHMLNALAKGAGARNFQSYRAQNLTNRSGEVLIALSAARNTLRELYERDASGEIQDRRHTTTNCLLFGLNVEIDLGAASVEIVLRARAGGQFTADSEPDETIIEDKALRALADSLATTPIDFHESQSVAVDLEARTTSALRGNGRATCLQRVSAAQFAALCKSAAEVHASTKACEDCVEYLREVAEEPERASREATPVRQALSYLEDIVECSGQPFMYAWNQEKISGIQHIVSAWMRRQPITEQDRRYVFDNLFVFNSPTAWHRRLKRTWPSRPE